MCSEVFNEWTTKEKFILACCVSRSGDQNWVSVSRTIKLINEACGDSDNRPPEWFSQKNCAMKYNELLGTASSSKRKSRGGPAESVNIETPAEQVLRKLTFARIDELNRTIELEREKFKKLKSDLQKIQSGKIDDQLPAIWEAIQSSKPQSLEKLIKDDPIGGSSSKAQQGTSQASASSSGLSRPQRASKETEKFKSYIEQRQKHLAKYQQSQVSTVGVTTLSPVISTGSAQTVTTVTPSAVVTPAAVSSIASPSLKGTVTGHIPTQVSNLTSQSESAISVTKDANKPKQQPINTVSPKKLDVKDSFLSNLLSAPTKEIKEQVNQITEILKEPIKNPHHISDESYQAYLKAQPATTPSIAPVLSKLLEVPSGEISTAATTDTVLAKSQNSTTKAPIERQASCENTDSQTINKTKSVDDSVNTKETRTTQVELSDKSKIQLSESGSDVEKKPTNSEKLLKSRKEDIISKLSETLKKSPLKKELLKLSDKIPKKSETEAEKTDVTNQAENLTVKTMDVEENKVETKDSSQEKTDGPPAKKRHSNTSIADNTLVSQESVPVEPSPPKTKKKGKGRSRTSTKKKVQPSQSNSFNVEMIADEDFSQSSFNDSSNNSKNESDFVDDIINKKVSTPLTPSVSSPASPALSIGSNCDPEVAQQQRAWRKNIMMVWKAAASHKYANVFLHPVTDEEAPGYSSIIYKPMDLSLIKKNIETGVTTTTAEFQRDIMLMFQNALMYNRKEHDVYRMATEMRDDVMEQIQSFISTQLMVQSTSEQRDAKILRLKPEGQGQTRQSIKSNSSL